MRKTTALIIAGVALCSTFAMAQFVNAQNANETEVKDSTATASQASASQASAQADKAVQNVFDTLLTSIQENDYSGFAVAVDDTVKAALTKDIFARVHADVAPRLNAGYEKHYFGTLNKSGHKVYLWKLSFKDGGDDILAEMSIKDEKVSGIFLR